MGIRFACHVCAKQLNIKQDLAGKRGICPACSSKFRIPEQDAAMSLPLDSPKETNLAKPIAQSVPQSVSQSVPQPVAQPDRPADDPPENDDQAKQDAVQNEKAEQESNRVASEQPATTLASQPKPGVEFDVLSDDPDATWYVRPPSGGQYGPADGNVLRGWIDEGRVAATALLWRDGWPNWRTASEVLPGLASHVPATVSEAASQTTSPLNPSGPFNPSGPLNPSGPTKTVATDSPASPAVAPAGAVVSAAEFSGRADVGAERRQRNGRRILLIGILSAVAVSLVGVLIFILTRSG